MGFGPKLIYVTDILQAYEASVAAGTPMLTADGKPAWSAEGGIAADYRGGAKANTIDKASKLPPSVAEHYWANGWYSNSGIIPGTNQNFDSKKMWLGYASVVSQYAKEVEAWLNQLNTQMKDPGNQTAVMNYAQYRAGDLKSSGSFGQWVGQIFQSAGAYFNSIFNNGLSTAAPQVFGYSAGTPLSTGVAANSTVAKNVQATVSGVDRLIDIVMGIIQNSIIKQASSDIRSFGGATDKGSYAPATLTKALALNEQLTSIADSLGLLTSADTAVATAAYRAIADGIVEATIRNFKYGMTTALNTLGVQAANPLATDYPSGKVYSVADFAKLDGFSPTDPLAMTNKDQKVTDATSLMAQSAGYSWIMKVGKPLLTMAASDAVAGKVKTDIKSIADGLQTQGAITPNEYASLLNNSPNTAVSDYIRDSANGAAGAQAFLLQLYTAEAKAVTNAKADYLKDPGTTTTLNSNQAANTFTNPGDPNQANPTAYAMADYTNIYAYLQSYDAAYKAMAAADNAAHAAANTASGGQISTTPASVPDLSAGALVMQGNLANTDNMTALAPQSLAAQVYRTVYAAEAEKANAAFQAGKKAAAATAVDKTTGLLAIKDLAAVTYTDGSTQYTTTNDGTAAAYEKRNAKTTDEGQPKGQAFIDGFNAATVKITVKASSSDGTFKAPSDTIGYALNDAPVTITAPDIPGWYAKPATQSGTYHEDTTLAFTYTKGASMTAKTATSTPATALFSGSKASDLIQPLVKLTWSDQHAEYIGLIDPSHYTVVNDGTAVGDYKFIVTPAGAQAILTALQGRPALATGYQLPTIADLTGITGTLFKTIQPSSRKW